MEFRIEECVILIMKKGKRETIDGKEQFNQESIKLLGVKETYKYQGILEAGYQDAIRDERVSKKAVPHKNKKMS